MFCYALFTNSVKRFTDKPNIAKNQFIYKINIKIRQKLRYAVYPAK